MSSNAILILGGLYLFTRKPTATAASGASLGAYKPPQKPRQGSPQQKAQSSGSGGSMGGAGGPAPAGAGRGGSSDFWGGPFVSFPNGPSVLPHYEGDVSVPDPNSIYSQFNDVIDPNSGEVGATPDISFGLGDAGNPGVGLDAPGFAIDENSGLAYDTSTNDIALFQESSGSWDGSSASYGDPTSDMWDGTTTDSGSGDDSGGGGDW